MPPRSNLSWPSLIKSFFVATLSVGSRTQHTTVEATCAPITNAYGSFAGEPFTGTWAASLTNQTSKNLETYPPIGADTDHVMAFASAESGQGYLNDLADSPYSPRDDSCRHPGGNATADCIPSALTQWTLYQPYLRYDAVYITMIGGNDFFNNVEKLIGKLDPFAGSHALQPYKKAQLLEEHAPALSHLIKNIGKLIQLQLSAGIAAKNIYISTLFDFSKVPAAINLVKGNKLALKGIQAISFILNQLIILNVKSLLPSEQIIRLDHFFKKIVTTPEAFGFNASLLERDCVSDEKLPDCTGYVFYNPKHPTGSVHRLVANDVLKTLKEAGQESMPRTFLGGSLTDSGDGMPGAAGNNAWCHH